MSEAQKKLLVKLDKQKRRENVAKPQTKTRKCMKKYLLEKKDLLLYS